MKDDKELSQMTVQELLDTMPEELKQLVVLEMLDAIDSTLGGKLLAALNSKALDVVSGLHQAVMEDVTGKAHKGTDSATRLLLIISAGCDVVLRANEEAEFLSNGKTIDEIRKAVADATPRLKGYSKDQQEFLRNLISPDKPDPKKMN